jgi:D-alanine-D-alanine ligase
MSEVKLCILYPAEFQDQDPTPYFKNWDASVCWISKTTAFEQIHALSQSNFDVFINLCDGCVDDAEAGIEVVHALEHFNLAFTSARSDFYDPSRKAMKTACKHAGVQTPAFVFVTTEREAENAVDRMRFPLIVKHPNGHSSVGMFRESRVETIEQLRTQVHRMIAEYGGALIEEFIDGREFDVLVVENTQHSDEPFAYPPIEFIFPPNESFKHYDLKWENYDEMTCVPCADPLIATRLQTMAKKFFRALDGSGYARCDFRMDARGELYALEINPNCGIFYPPHELGSADFILTQYPNGHHDFIERLVRAALSYQQRN